MHPFIMFRQNVFDLFVIHLFIIDEWCKIGIYISKMFLICISEHKTGKSLHRC
mgnify:CR=1 FL=1